MFMHGNYTTINMVYLVHIIVFFRMMCFIAVKEQGLALFMGKGISGNKTRLFG